MVITSLRGSNLAPLDIGINPSSDPFIVFYTDPTNLPLSVMKQHLNSSKKQIQNVFSSPISYPRTSVCNSTLNPVWPDEIVIPLGIEITNISDLQYCHLILLVMDKDLASQDDTIGTGIVSLSEVLHHCTEKETSYHFSIELECDGIVGRGTVEGDINLVIPTEKEIEFSFKQQQSWCKIN